MLRPRTTLAFVFLVQLVASSFAEDVSIRPDVVVYGATPAGIAAAIEASSCGRSVLLAEPTGRIGGLLTNGLSHSDFHSFESLNGPFHHFSKRVLKYYRDTYGEDSQQVSDCWRGTHGEPSVNLLVIEHMLQEHSRITVQTGFRLDGVVVENQAISAVRFQRPDASIVSIRPGQVIDASYEGDLMAAAGVPYRVGREARGTYQESLAPETADNQVQGYNYRFCMTQNPDNRVPVPVPEHYRRSDYAAIVPLVNSGEFDNAFGYPGRRFLLKAHLPPLPNGKRDINDVSKGLVRLSMPGRNRDYPDGDLETRRRIEREHLDWQLGLIHFLQTDPELPEAFREEAASWGLCRDEFVDNGHLPIQIYVREARRMVGMKVYTESDTDYAPDDARAKWHEDSIAVGEYSHNCHGTGHEGDLIGGRHTGEFYKGVAPYQIPYGVMVPNELTNLLVPGACSASHVGFCALRLEPIWMSLGGAAGQAAAMALEHDLPVQQVNVQTLQQRIWNRGGATIHVSDVPPSHPDFVAVQWWGTLGGLHGLESAPAKPGTRGAHIVSQYFEAFPGHALQLDQPVSNELASRWRHLAIEKGLPAERLPPVDAKLSRVQWIRSAHQLASQLASTDLTFDTQSDQMLTLQGLPTDPATIDFSKLRKVPAEHAIISDVRDQAGHWVHQHMYLAYFEGRYWAIWSDGPGVPKKNLSAEQHRNVVPGHDQVGTQVSYATSLDGKRWSEPKDVSGLPRKPGFGWIARGLWVRDGELLALASHFRAPGYPGKGLSLESFRWNEAEQCWTPYRTVKDDTLNNFPPKRLPTGQYMMTRRDHRRQVSMLIGGERSVDQWSIQPLASYDGNGRPEEPYWYILPDGKNLVGLIRDNGRSGRLLRTFSTTNGKTWSPLVKTNFPDATSKFFVLRTSRGYYVLVSNANPRKRDPLTLAVSRDGIHFTHLFSLVDGRHVDYPHVIENDDHLLIGFSGAKQTAEVLKLSLNDLDRMIE